MTQHTHFLVPRQVLAVAANLSPSGLTLYLHLASLAEPEGMYASASTSELSSRTGLARRSVFAGLSDLRRLGLMTREKTSPTGVGAYRLVVRGDEGSNGERQPACAKADSTDPNLSPGDSPKCASFQLGIAGPSSNQPGESLHSLIAKAYRPDCAAATLRALTGLSDVDLQRCLQELLRDGGVAADQPIGFLGAALLSIDRRSKGESRLRDPKN